MPKPSSSFTDQVPLEMPPMTGSLTCINLKVVEGSPSNVTKEISEEDNVLIVDLTFVCFCPAVIDLTSMWASPFTPSAHNSIRLILPRSSIVGHTFGSSAQVTVWSPVAGSHLLLNALKGIRTSEKSSPASILKSALKSLNAFHVLPKDTLYPVYSAVELRMCKTRSPVMADEASLNRPCAVALINPGALRDGTSRTSPSSIPYPPSPLTDHEPLETPPITGSLVCLN